MKRILVIAALGLVGLVAVLVARTLRYGSPQIDVETAQRVQIPAGADQRLAGALRIRTISPEDPATFSGDAFQALHSYLQSAFPRTHAELQRELVGIHSLLYTWLGSDPSLRPILLMGHMDVVPVEPGTEGSWQQDPFGGQILDGFIWGRGAIDNKSTVLGTLEAVEMLLSEGFRPARTVYLAYGHDEEVGGNRGAREIAALLAGRGVQLEAVVDEGGVIGDGVLPGVVAPTALVGIAEKGFVTVELLVRGTGGHSSLPPQRSTIGILGEAVARLEQNQMPARLEGPTRQLFEYVAPQLPLVQRAAFANLWLTQPLLIRRLETTPTTNAMVRTTTATTIFQAGTKDNVLPSQARAVVNFRILPGDSIVDVLEHVRSTISDDRVEIRQAGAFWAEPSTVSSLDSESFQALTRAIRSISPDANVAPYLVVVVTDSRYFQGLSSNVFRFLPLRLTSEDLARIHGTDERIAANVYANAIRLYRQLIIEAAG